MKVCLFADARSVHVQRIAAGLVARDVEVHLVTHKPASLPGVSVERFRVPPVGVRHPFRWPERWMRQLGKYMRRFDVVHVHFLQDWGFTPEIMRQGCFVVSPWGSDLVAPPGEEFPSSALVQARVSMLRHAACVTAWGPRFAAAVAEFAELEVESIELLPLGVDLDLFRPLESPTPMRRSDDDTATHRVGFFKGFREVYGATHLLHAIPRVLERFPRAQFELIGDGPQLAECMKLAGELGIDFNVTWIVRHPHQALPEYLSHWNLSVIPSVCESFGAAALESSAMGVPVVASDVGGLPDTVRHGQTGWLVPPRSPDALAEAIIRLLEDEPLRRRMGRAGRAMVEREYDWQKILDHWVETYAAAIDRVSVMV